MKSVIAALLLTISFAHATHYRPWLGNDLEPVVTGQYIIQEYNQVKEDNKSVDLCSLDYFTNLGAYIAYAPYSLEIETNQASTSRTSYGWNDAVLTGCYQFMDDISGEDFVSAVGGFSISPANTRFVQDISTFHHGNWEYFLFGSVGKEQSCGPTWSQRAWGLYGVGWADKGSIWMTFHAAYERNACDRYWYGVFLTGLFGFGAHNLVIADFNGYGPINHHSLDIGGRFTYSFLENGCFTIKYAFRVYAQNFPAYVNLATLEFQYPFGTGI